MNRFSAQSKERLESCHIDLQELFTEVLRYYDCSIIEGHRSRERQAELYNKGLSKVTESKHNQSPSLAVDVAPYLLGGIHWEDIPSFYQFAGAVLVIAQQLLEAGKISHRVRWGGDWNSDRLSLDETFQDCVHFELLTVH